MPKIRITTPKTCTVSKKLAPTGLRVFASEKYTERVSKSLNEPVRARGSQSGSHSYPFGRLVTKKRLASHF